MKPTESVFDGDLSKMLAAHCADLSERIAKAEESFIVKAIMLAGYEPIASPDAEWTKHVTLHYVEPGRKEIYVDGQPKWRIITEAPSVPWDKSEIVNMNYTTRMEAV